MDKIEKIKITRGKKELGELSIDAAREAFVTPNNVVQIKLEFCCSKCGNNDELVLGFSKRDLLILLHSLE